MKQNSIRVYSFLTVYFLLFGCTNKIANSILFDPPLHKDINITKKLSDEFHYDLRSIETSDGNILSAVEYYTDELEENNKGVILFLHGNSEDIYSVSSPSLAFANLGYDMLFIDYRGYGKSTGSPTAKGLNLDIQSAVNYLTKEYDDIYIYGRSIGGTSILGALDEIDKYKIRAIVTEGAFLSYKQLSKDRGLSIPFTNYNELELYSPLTSDRNTTLPLMLIHSINDEVVPYSQGLALYKHFIHSKHFKIFGKHVQFLDNIPSYTTISNFFQKNKNYHYTKLVIDNNSTKKLSSDVNKTIDNNLTILNKDVNISKGVLNE